MLSILFLKLSPLFFGAFGDPCSVPHKTFFFLPPWWEYVKNGSIDAFGQCTPTAKLPGDLWSIGLAVLDILLRLAGFVAVIMIIVAGLEYILASGNAEKGASARKRIINSLIGLAIALVATATVSFIGRTLG